MRRLIFSTAFVGAALAGAALVGQAHASPSPVLELSLSESGFATETFSSTPGNTLSETVTYGGYRLTVTGSGDIIDLTPYLSLTASITTVPSTLAALTISLTETGLPTGPGSVVDMSAANTALFHVAGNSVKTFAYYDFTDTPFGEQNQFYTSTLTSTSTSTSFEGVFDAAEPISITDTLVYTPGSRTAHPLLTSQINTSIPEPLTISLLLPALVGLGLIGQSARRRA